MWNTVKLGDVCELRNGRAYKKPELLEAGRYPVLRVGNFFTNNNWYYSDLELDETKYCDNGDLLYAWSASFGPRIWDGGKVIYHYHIWRVDVREELIDKKFLFYWFEYDKEKIKAAHGTGTTMMHVSKGSMEKRDFLLPPIAQQQQIVAKLDAAFAEIDKAIELAETKEAEIEKLKASMLSSMLNKADWETVKLGEVCEYSKRNAQSSQLPYVGMENISSSTMQLVGKIEVPESTSSTFEFDESHVLYGRLRPYLRKILVPNFRGQCSTEIFCLKPKSVLVRKFLAYWLLEPSVGTRIEATCTGARMPRANMNALLTFRLPLPPISQQQQIVAKLDAAFAEIDRAKASVAKMKANYAALKSAILTRELQPEKSEAV